jgi:imidazole glycerol-phosphate synthase subunit HisF
LEKVRLIARLDIKGDNLIKGIHLEGLRVLGNSQEKAQEYYNQGADELIYIDLVASLYGRSKLTEIIRLTATNVFVPLTVGGGIRNIDDVADLLRAGADKIALNTAAINRPELIREIAQKYGAQCVVVSIEAKRTSIGKWEAFTEAGREPSGRDVVEWAKYASKLGAGELLVTSIDQEGTGKGFDNKLIKAISDSVSIPVIASGGYGELKHVTEVVQSGANALAIAGSLHYDKITVPEIRKYALAENISVRRL